MKIVITIGIVVAQFSLSLCLEIQSFFRLNVQTCKYMGGLIRCRREFEIIKEYLS